MSTDSDNGGIYLRKRLIISFFILILLICGCGHDDDQGQDQVDVHIIKDPVSETVKSGASSGSDKMNDVNSKSIGAWITYWDLDTAYDELELLGEDLDTLCYFAAYFDNDNEPFIPEGTLGTMDKLKQDGSFGKTVNYLTFVNDKLLNQGSSLKDTELLYDLIGNEKKAKKHAEQITDMTVSSGFDGIEIDYEAIKKDYELCEHFRDFVNILVPMAHEKGLSVRILFEPGAPIEKYEWPSDVEYVMMCYNLYGYGTKPGPKADKEFLKEMVTKMETLPGTVNFALATGGFDFTSDGSVMQIDTRTAKAVAMRYEAKERIDEASGDHVYEYTDEDGLSHEVWYADQDTLRLWIQTIKDEGHERITIWRIGGNI